MELDAVERRILGCLVEKEAATPDNYPLSTNALMAACNQSTNREPVMSLDERTIDATMLELRAAGLARTVTGGRANKHRHVLDEAWGLNQGALALLAVLFLRGPQTLNELKTRTERLHDFADLTEVEAALEALARRDEPFVVHLERQVGQKERRWAHLLGGDAPVVTGEAADGVDPSPTAAPTPTPGATRPTSPPDDGLRAEVARLRADVDRLYRLLGETPEGP